MTTLAVCVAGRGVHRGGSSHCAAVRQTSPPTHSRRRPPRCGTCVGSPPTAGTGSLSRWTRTEAEKIILLSPCGWVVSKLPNAEQLGSLGGHLRL
eukprot:1189305-Prorocentrum_minimum.AAC.2